MTLAKHKYSGWRKATPLERRYYNNSHYKDVGPYTLYIGCNPSFASKEPFYWGWQGRHGDSRGRCATSVAAKRAAEEAVREEIPKQIQLLMDIAKALGVVLPEELVEWQLMHGPAGRILADVEWYYAD